MNTNPLDLELYLERINYHSTLETSYECLKNLQTAQLQSIPFENFDIQLGRSIDLAPEKIIEKLVHTRRGGYCFELNSLFLMALREIGFDARALLGRVHLPAEPTGRAHQICLVTLEGKHWVVDAGFGASTPRLPFYLEQDMKIEWRNRQQRIVESQRFGFMLQTQVGDSWEDTYSFDLGYVCQGDIDYGNYYMSTHPGSTFVTSRVASLATPNGMRTLHNNTLKIEENDERDTVEVSAGAQYMEMLEAQFGIRLGQDFNALREIPNEL